MFVLEKKKKKKLKIRQAKISFSIELARRSEGFKNII